MWRDRAVEHVEEEGGLEKGVCGRVWNAGVDGLGEALV